MSSRFRPVIRVFVSSTFSDLKEERNALQREVFPHLEHYCLVRGFQFQAIDLRWGVPGEAGRDHRTMQICFDELRRAQEVSPRPNFLVLLGDRYGWQPLAETITEAEFQALERAADELDNDAASEVQARGSAMQALRTWYRRDDNADPVEYQLRSRNDWPGLPEWTEEDEEQAWKKVEETLWAVINRAYPHDGLAGRFGQIPGADEPLPSIVKFQASATEQEIWRGALAVPDAEKHVVAWYRAIRNRETCRHDERAKDYFDPREERDKPAADLREELRRRLARGGDHPVIDVEADLAPSADGKRLELTRDHLQPMCEEIEKRLRTIIDEEIANYWNPGIAASASTGEQSVVAGPSEARKLELERQVHERFSLERAPEHGFVGREKELAAIAAYLHDTEDRNPLVIYGPSGAGKTAILARAAQIANRQYKDRVFLRFLGTTPQSSNLHALLMNLCREMRPDEEAEKDLPFELRLLQEELDRLLATATGERPILLFLDAIDQLDDADGARQTYWLRTPLPEHVKVAVSCIRNEDTPEKPDKLNEPYRAFERRRLLDRAISVESLTEKEAMRAMDLWLAHPRRKQGKRRLEQKQREAIEARIQSSEACRRPLYLRVLYEEARLWPSWKVVAADALGANTAELLGLMFGRLEDKAVHGTELVRAAMGYLVAARRGLSENEMLEVLWADEDYRRHLEEVSRKTNHELPEGATRIPIAIWSRLRHDLAPYLTERDAPGGMALSIYHREVERVVRMRYLREGAQRILRHQRLAGYFESELQPWWQDADTSARITATTARKRFANVRRAYELPQQMLELYRGTGESEFSAEHAQTRNAIEALFLGVDFLQAKVEAGLIFDLIENFEAVLKTISDNDPTHRALLLLQRALTQSAHIVQVDPTQAASQLHARLMAVAEPGLASTVGQLHQRLGRIVPRWPTLVQADSELLRTLEGHTSGVLSVAVSSDGSALVSASDDKTIKVWDLRTGACLRTLEGHAVSVALSGDGSTLVSASNDKTIKVWDLSTGACLRTLEGHTNSVNSVALCGDGITLASGSDDSTIKVWDLRTGDCLRTLKEHTRPVLSVAVSSDGNTLVSASNDKTIKVWDLRSNSCLRTLEGDYQPSMALSSDGSILAIGSYQGWITVWCLRTVGHWMPARNSYEVNPGTVNSLALSADGSILAMASKIRAVEIFSLKSGARRQLSGHVRKVHSVAFGCDGSTLVSGSQDKTIKVWAISPNAPRRKSTGHARSVSSVALNRDGSTIVSGSWDSNVKVWNLQTGECLRTLEGQTGGVLSVALDTNGNTLVSCSNDDPHKTIKVWDLARSACLRRLEGHDGRVTSVALSGDGITLVSGSDDKTIKIWDLRTGACLRTLKDHTEEVRWAAFNRDESNSNDLNDWTTEGPVYSVALSTDRSTVVSSHGDWTIRVWDLRTGACLRRLGDHNGRVSSVALDRGGGKLVSASQDKTIKVWDLRTGSCVRTLEGIGSVDSIALSGDGSTVIFCSDDKTIKMWDLRLDVCMETFYGDAEFCSLALAAENNSILVAGDSAGRIHLFELRSTFHKED